MARIETQEAREFNLKEDAIINDFGTRCGEAIEVADLYRKVYKVKTEDSLTQLSYPYPEVFDPEWIQKTATDRNVVWRTVVDTLTDKVIGSGTVVMDLENQRGYVRGVMIDPDYQGYGLASYILVNAFREVIGNWRDHIKIFYTENRTAHAKSQKISEASGMYPVALLPNKDIFLEKRETDLLFVLYSMNTLKIRRPEPQLIPEVIPIFKTVGRQFRLDDAISVTPSVTHANGFEIKASITTDKYNYHYCTYRAHGQELKFEINPRTQVAEKMWFSPEIDPITLKTLLRFARLSLNPTLYYMECYVSAFKPDFQQVFVDLGFTPTGYIPGWEMVNGQREDQIIMTWVKDPPLLENLRLTRRAEKIAKLFLS